MNDYDGMFEVVKLNEYKEQLEQIKIHASLMEVDHLADSRREVEGKGMSTQVMQAD